MIVLLYFFAFLINRCVGVIYHLNDSEYNRMPALFALDDYQSCMSNPEGLYCLAQFDLHSDQSTELITLIRVSINIF
ncbi:unnamed protein product [Parnassius mnemosyne]|uniref:Secreted protein n=1 Tax=Parnassius mnemosyne TaxID=213953 RepID=A0AAV1KM28_9NEOP